jgi:hypothetical protein
MTQNRIVILGRPGIELPENFLQLLGDALSQQPNHVDVIDETEATPVLEDVPEDPEVTIERLNAQALTLQAELEEHRRSVDGVLELLTRLGTIPDAPVAPEYVNKLTQASAQSEGGPRLGTEAGYAFSRHAAKEFLQDRP